jgi:hypothetical protein
VESFESVEAEKDFFLHLRHLCQVDRERLTEDRESWIMKDCDSRYWIGGEGIPSRDQIKEKREQRLLQVGFSQVKPHGRVMSYKVFLYIFVHVRRRQWRYVCVCGCAVGTVMYISKIMQF